MDVSTTMASTTASLVFLSGLYRRGQSSAKTTMQIGPESSGSDQYLQDSGCSNFCGDYPYRPQLISPNRWFKARYKRLLLEKDRNLLDSISESISVMENNPPENNDPSKGNPSDSNRNVPRLGVNPPNVIPDPYSDSAFPLDLSQRRFTLPRQVQALNPNYRGIMNRRSASSRTNTGSSTPYQRIGYPQNQSNSSTLTEGPRLSFRPPTQTNTRSSILYESIRYPQNQSNSTTATEGPRRSFRPPNQTDSSILYERLRRFFRPDDSPPQVGYGLRSRIQSASSPVMERPSRIFRPRDPPLSPLYPPLCPLYPPLCPFPTPLFPFNPGTSATNTSTRHSFTTSRPRIPTHPLRLFPSHSHQMSQPQSNFGFQQFDNVPYGSSPQFSAATTIRPSNTDGLLNTPPASTNTLYQPRASRPVRELPADRQVPRTFHPSNIRSTITPPPRASPICYCNDCLKNVSPTTPSQNTPILNYPRCFRTPDASGFNQNTQNPQGSILPINNSPQNDAPPPNQAKGIVFESLGLAPEICDLLRTTENVGNAENADSQNVVQSQTHPVCGLITLYSNDQLQIDHQKQQIFSATELKNTEFSRGMNTGSQRDQLNINPQQQPIALSQADFRAVLPEAVITGTCKGQLRTSFQQQKTIAVPEPEAREFSGGKKTGSRKRKPHQTHHQEQPLAVCELQSKGEYSGGVNSGSLKDKFYQNIQEQTIPISEPESRGQFPKAKITGSRKRKPHQSHHQQQALATPGLQNKGEYSGGVNSGSCTDQSRMDCEQQSIAVAKSAGSDPSVSKPVVSQPTSVPEYGEHSGEINSSSRPGQLHLRLPNGDCTWTINPHLAGESSSGINSRINTYRWLTIKRIKTEPANETPINTEDTDEDSDD